MRMRQSNQVQDRHEGCDDHESFALHDLADLMASSPAYYQVFEGGARRWVSGELVGQGKPSARAQKEHKEKTPVEGPHAVQNWLALHDRAQLSRATLDVTKSHLRRQAHQAVASLFLYEHQLTEKARRQARLALWDREHPDTAPSTAHPSHLLIWSRCRCPRCQPALHRPQLSGQEMPPRQRILASA